MEGSDVFHIMYNLSCNNGVTVQLKVPKIPNFKFVEIVRGDENSIYSQVTLNFEELEWLMIEGQKSPVGTKLSRNFDLHFYGENNYTFLTKRQRKEYKTIILDLKALQGLHDFWRDWTARRN